MLGQHSPSHALVRAVSDDALAHGDVTFAIGLVIIVGGSIVTFVGLSLLRIVGVM